ncbi:MAG TPA: phosphatidate cytidylyltransferase [Ferruginibacter sp.]|nr:phosphatidate cytidylyltransferase [Ferruginibacter sp.]HMP20711.1 phosphatidate cytidylyltransferase [Ferruginibacter sp.]
MALNLQTLKTRSLTAAIFVAVMLTGLLWNRWSFLVLFIIIHFGCWHEFVKLMKLVHREKYLTWCPAGLLYITLPVLLLIDLRFDNIFYKGTHAFIDLGYIIPCTIIFSIWINDTMAYIVGSLIGKTPFSTISPKKTWEGTGGGALLCIVVMGIIGHFVFGDYRAAVIIAAICAVFGTVGDLLESKIKRLAGVKDSGSIMPGHGGFLDRFDSLLVAVPFVWLFVRLTD